MHYLILFLIFFVNSIFSAANNGHDYTLFLSAIIQGDNKLVKEYQEKNNFDLNIQEPESGYTALHIAATSEQYETYELLIYYGANQDICDFRGKTADYYADISERFNQTRYILPIESYHNTKRTKRNIHHYKFLVAAKNGNLQAVSAYIKKHKLSPDTADFRSGLTALHHAAINQNYHMINLLLTLGANPNKRDKSGRSALYYLAISNKDNCNIANYWPDSFEAINFKRLKILYTNCVLRLINADADPDLKTDYELSAIDICKK